MNEKITVVGASKIGSYFREVREKAGMSQSETARCTEISQQLISMLEKEGIRSGTHWDKVCKLLEFYATRGSKSMFALVYKDGALIETLSEVYSSEKTSLKQQLMALLEQLGD